MTDGTTLCPHCATRFRIAEAQLTAHQGMVRCGHCREAFDARTNYQPDQPSPQLDLPIDDAPAPSGQTPDTEHAAPDAEATRVGEIQQPTGTAAETPDYGASASAEAESGADTCQHPETDETQPDALIADDRPDFSAPAVAQTELPERASEQNKTASQEQHGEATPSVEHQPQPEPEDASQNEPSQVADNSLATPADEHAEVSAHDAPPDETVGPAIEAAESDILLAGYLPQSEEQGNETPDDAPVKRRVWPWVTGIVILLLLLVAQSAYFFRVGLAAHLPALKPALAGYSHLLGSDVPLPRNAELMSIESSSLNADADHVNQVNLDALLRNRASYTQAFPILSLTLNDMQDKPLASRIFLPADYLPGGEKEVQGMAANHELIIQLHMDTADLRPVGYRLELYYPQ